MAIDETSSKDGLPYPGACRGWAESLPHWRVDVNRAPGATAIDPWLKSIPPEEVWDGGSEIFLVHDEHVADLIDRHGPWVWRAQRVNLIQP